MNRSEQAYALAAIEFARNRPHTQEDCCALAARVAIGTCGAPMNETQIFSRAVGLAKGLFGPAYGEADECQRTAWIDMCERALRDEIKR